MAIASFILTPQAAQTNAVKAHLEASPIFSLEAETPNGELVILGEAADLQTLIKASRELAEQPGVLNVAPSYVTEADETYTPRPH